LSAPLEITFPDELLLAMGISAASFAGSTLIKQSKATKTVTVDAKLNPESAAQRKKEADRAVADKTTALESQSEAERIRKATVDTAEKAVSAAVADPEKHAAADALAKARTMHLNAEKDKATALNELDDAKKAAALADEDLATIKEAQGRLHRNADPTDASWVDLFRGEEISNYRLVDMSKVQMMVFTFVIVVAYGADIGRMLQGDLRVAALSFPAFGATLNALLGISHGTYLSVKAVDHG
jgi:hypothetical protein